jgi:hypothetical protein
MAPAQHAPGSEGNIVDGSEMRKELKVLKDHADLRAMPGELLTDWRCFDHPMDPSRVAYASNDYLAMGRRLQKVQTP